MGVQRAFTVFALARRHARRVMQIGGLLLIAIGIRRVSGIWASLIVHLQRPHRQLADSPLRHIGDPNAPGGPPGPRPRSSGD